MTPADHREGWNVTISSYNRGCRCTGCYAKRQAYDKGKKDSARVRGALIETVEKTYARTGSITATMNELGLDYRLVWCALSRMRNANDGSAA